MPEKLNKEQFRIIKNQMTNIIDRLNNLDLDELYYTPSNNEAKKELYNQYYELQKKLLSYDLSDIPFHEWKSLKINNNGDIIDLSKTKANIDFSIVYVDAYCNFKNCNIQNLQHYKKYINPDYFDEKTIKENPDIFLSDIFSSEFQKKYYHYNLTMDDLIILNDLQIAELSNKDIFKRLKDIKYQKNYFEYINLKKAIELYKYSKDDYYTIINLIEFNTNKNIEDNINDRKDNLSNFIYELKKAEIKDIKKLCYEYARDNILTGIRVYANPLDLPAQFIKDNDDLFLINVNMPKEVRAKFQLKEINFEQLIKYNDVFKDVPISYYIKDGNLFKIISKVDYDNFKKIFYEHLEFFKHLYDNNKIKVFSDYFNTLSEKNYDDYEDIFYSAVKVYCYNYLYDEFKLSDSCFNSFNFNIIQKYNSWEEMKDYNKNTILLDQYQSYFISKFGIENMKNLEKESGFFSHIFNNDKFPEEIFYDFLNYSPTSQKLDFKNGTLSYKDFEDNFSSMLYYMRRYTNYFENYDYNFIEGPFRDNHPNLFLSKGAPLELIKAFFTNKITLNFLQKHPEYTTYLLDKDIASIIVGNFEFKYASKNSNQYDIINFLTFYEQRFGKEELLNLLLGFGEIASDLSKLKIDDYDIKNSNKEVIDDLVRVNIYTRVLNTSIDYHSIKDEKFRNIFAELFIDLKNITTIPEEHKLLIEDYFYKRIFAPDLVKMFPDLIDVLKNKNLPFIFHNYYDNSRSTKFGFSYNNEAKYSKNILDYIGNKNYLILCSKYGNYIECVTPQKIIFRLNQMGFESNIPNKLEDLMKICEIVIADECYRNGYIYHPDAPEFLKEMRPELFLDMGVPKDLEIEFYRGFSFYDLKDNNNWKPYLENKEIMPALIKGNPSKKESIITYFKLFGKKDAFKFAFQKSMTVQKMIDTNKVELMYKWYQKSGKKFIPDYVIMQNIPFEEADKFFASISYWTKLMKIDNFSKNEEARDAMLKLAYSFGVFDQDKSGFKKLEDLLSGIPNTITAKDFSDLSQIKNFSKMDDSDFYKNIINEYNKLKTSLKNEGCNFNFDEDIIDQLYKKSNDKYVLTINSQQYPKSMKILRNCMELISNDIVMTPNKAHQIFGGFTLEYNREFREFLLDNLDNINEENSTYISSIQKQFNKIKAMNSNRVLTLYLAISFVQQNKYKNIMIGNERMAEIASIAGYSQEDFNTLQEIYNYGKKRTFSSIPRIKNKTEKYTYEILRLDDPLALAIGTLSDCCQEIGNAAEVCMEHSMVDANGRIFVIRDNEGNIVSQSWVWRNKDVLCFDNIEIPGKAFKRAELNKEDFAKEVYDIYKQASKELMEEDEKVYKQLLDDGKITEEQYNGLRLGKVTVGLGYNDIASAIKKNAIRDNSILSRPLNFEPPVELNRGLYTSDSTTQYILEERDNRIKYKGPTLSVHNDIYKIYDDSNFTEKELYLLNKLESTTNDSYYLNTEIDEEKNDKIISNLALTYRLNPEKTKIIMNYNFAIIYEDNEAEIVIGDLFYNSELLITNSNEFIMLQIKLALEQIAKNKTIDISNLEVEKQELLNEIMKESLNIDTAKGLSNK